MPSSDSILSNAALIANDAWVLAVFWHLIVASAGLSMLQGWRPSEHKIGLLAAAPLASVSGIAFLYGNTFNGVVFVALAAFAFGLSFGLGRKSAKLGPVWTRIAGMLMLAFAWFYPHFIEPTSLLTYAVASPMGLLPCPTLALLIGVTLIANGLSSRPWSVLLGMSGLIYGLVGVAFLRVPIDLALIAGGLALLTHAAIESLRSHRNLVEMHGV